MAGDAQSVPVEWIQRVARDEDEVSELVRQMYCDTAGLRSPGETEFVFDSVAAGRLRTDRVRNSFRFQTTWNPFERLMFFHFRRGGARIDDGTDRAFAPALAALAAFPNTTMTEEPPPGPGWAGPAPVRRAMAYIEAHAGEPITVPEIAAAAGTGARAPQRAFARHYASSPSRYLRQVRLDRAHHQLQEADAAGGDTVAAIAARWGFARPDRFATHYRAVYGVPPSHTAAQLQPEETR